MIRIYYNIFPSFVNRFLCMFSVKFLYLFSVIQKNRNIMRFFLLLLSKKQEWFSFYEYLCFSFFIKRSDNRFYLEQAEVPVLFCFYAY